ncbi:MAG TPA: TolC family protein [Terracidiphilus sp.]|nr:TolC family protein [Terracidiphilus sp.]
MPILLSATPLLGSDFVAGRQQIFNASRSGGFSRLASQYTLTAALSVGMVVASLFARCVLAQSAPASPDHPWHGHEEQEIEADGKNFRAPSFGTEPDRTYSLAELIDLAESHNPETRAAWERARAQAAALGVARSELYPTLAAAALSGVARSQAYLVDRFYRQTIADFQVTLNLNYTVFDFGARAGRISAARAEVLSANFSFNDTHRKIIYQVEQAYYQLLNALGQEDAARANLSNAQAVQQSAEERLRNGLATLPDVLEARSATAQAEYELQSVVGTEQIAAGNLATVLGTSATTTIHVQPLNELAIPQSVDESVDVAINRALGQRPDLLQQVADVRSANSRVKEARAANYPSLSLTASPTAQSLYGMQQQYPWGHTAGLTGGLAFSLNWTVFDGGARKNRLAQAEANLRSSEAQVSVSRDQIANEVWTAYSNLNTALRQRQAAIALLEAASHSYDAALESYNYGLRNLLDVTAAQRTLAQARSTDVLARTQVLTSLADLVFRSGDAIQPGLRSLRP